MLAMLLCCACLSLYDFQNALAFLSASVHESCSAILWCARCFRRMSNLHAFIRTTYSFVPCETCLSLARAALQSASYHF